MSKDKKEKPVNVNEISSVLKNISLEDQKVAQRAYDEIEAITIGKKELSMKEFYELKIHAKKRTNLEKNDSELTPDEAIWKIFYNSIEKILVEKMGPDEKANLDSLQQEMDFLTELSDFSSKILSLGQEIETEIIMQRAALTVYFDKSAENNYKTVVDGVTTDLVNPDKWSPSERINKAQIVLKIINANRDHLYKKQLVERQETIRLKLNEFEKNCNSIDLIISKNPNILKDPSLHKLHNTSKEWLQLTKNLYTSRSYAISAVKNSLESDEFLPKLILEKNGDISGTISTNNTLFEQMSAVIVLVNKASEEENELSPKRDAFSEELFGKTESYLNLPEEESIESIPSKKQDISSLNTKTKWLIVVALTIVALSWGIWTAIGVFILGIIIIGILNK